MGLHEDGVDLLAADGFGLVADGFNEGSDAEVADGSKDAFRDADDQGDGFVAEGAVGEAGFVELVVEVGFDGGWGEEIEPGGVGDAALDVEVMTKLEGGVEGVLEAVDEVGGVVGGVESAVWDDTGGVVDEADEEGFQR